MNITAMIIWGKKAWTTINSIFTVCSLVVVPAAVTVPIVWALQTDHGPRFNSKSKAGSAVSGELVFLEEPLKVVYHLELLDQDGKSVMNYPEKVTKGAPNFDNIMLSVPESLRPGEYRLVARVRYALNPIKGGTSIVQVASISVD